MSGMQRSGQRVVAAAGMVFVGAGAGLLLFVSVLYEAHAFENTDPSERPFEFVAVLAAGGLVTAVVGLSALTTGSRAWARRAAVAQAACAVLLGVLWESMSEYRIEPLLIAALFASVAVDALAVWAARVSPSEPAASAARTAGASWTLTGCPMTPGILRHASLAAMLAIALTGALAVVVEQALGGPFNLRIAGGAGLLAVPAVIAVGGLVAGSREFAAGPAIVQGVTAALLLLLWDSPRWYVFEEYDTEDTAFNLYLAGVLITDAVLVLAALRPAREPASHRAAESLRRTAAEPPHEVGQDDSRSRLD
jgi:hypothetical protein